MNFSGFPKDQAPPGLLEVDWENPMADGLAVCIVYNNGRMVDLLRGNIDTADEITYEYGKGVFPALASRTDAIRSTKHEGGYKGLSVATRVHFSNQTVDQRIFEIADTDNSALFYFGVNSNSTVIRSHMFAGSSKYGTPGVMSTDDPHDIVVTLNRNPIGSTTQGHYYIDGDLHDGPEALGTEIWPQREAIAIGSRYNTSNTAFEGTMSYLFVWNDRIFGEDEVREIGNNPWQIVKSRVPNKLAITPTPTPLDYEYTVPDPKWEQPALLVPAKKPIGNVEIDRDNPIGRFIAECEEIVPLIAVPGGMQNLKTKEVYPPQYLGNGGEYKEGGWKNNSAGLVYFEFPSTQSARAEIGGALVGYIETAATFDEHMGFGQSAGSQGGGPNLEIGTATSLNFLLKGQTSGPINFTGSGLDNRDFAFCGFQADSDLSAYTDVYWRITSRSEYRIVDNTAGTASIFNMDTFWVGDEAGTCVIRADMAIVYTNDHLSVELADSFVRDPYQFLIPA